MNMFNALPSWVVTLTGAMKSIVNPILILAATAGIIYAIWIGIKFVKAEDKTQRDEAKQKLIYVIVGIVAAIALIVLFYWLAYALENGIINVANPMA